MRLTPPLIGVYFFPPDQDLSSMGRGLNLRIGLAKPDRIQSEHGYAAWAGVLPPAEGPDADPIPPLGEQLAKIGAEGSQLVALEVERSISEDDLRFLSEFRNQHPDASIVAMLYENASVQQDWARLDEVIDLFLIESYSYARSGDVGVIDDYAAILRPFGLLPKTLMGVLTTNLNAAADGAILSPSSFMPDAGAIEAEIAYVRKVAPEMPGVWFYYWNPEDRFVPQANLEALADLTHRYFERAVIGSSKDTFKLKLSPNDGGASITYVANNVGFTGARGVVPTVRNGRDLEFEYPAFDLPAQSDLEISLESDLAPGTYEFGVSPDLELVTVLESPMFPITVAPGWHDDSASHRISVATEASEGSSVRWLDLDTVERSLPEGLVVGDLRLYEITNSGPQGVACQVVEALGAGTNARLFWESQGKGATPNFHHYHLYFTAVAGRPEVERRVLEGTVVEVADVNVELDGSDSHGLSKLAYKGLDLVGETGWGVSIDPDTTLKSDVEKTLFEGPVLTEVRMISSTQTKLMSRYLIFGGSGGVLIERSFVPPASSSISLMSEGALYAPEEAPTCVVHQVGYSNVQPERRLDEVTDQGDELGLLFGSPHTPDIPNMPRPPVSDRCGWGSLLWPREGETESFSGMTVMPLKRWDQTRFPYPQVDLTGITGTRTGYKRLQVIQVMGECVVEGPQSSLTFLGGFEDETADSIRLKSRSLWETLRKAPIAGEVERMRE